MKHIRIILGLGLLFTPACAALKDTPVSVAYSAKVGGHDVTAAYSKKDGLVVSAQK